jgi:hypothetical protein
MKKRPREAGVSFDFCSISILPTKQEIVAQIGPGLIYLNSWGCGKSDLRKGLT